MEKYLEKLMEQFRSAKGIKSINESKEFYDDFLDWLELREELGNTYIELLEYMDLYFDSKECAEINKGPYDTVVKPFETTLITPVYPIREIAKDRIIYGKMEVCGATPVLIQKGTGINNVLTPIPTDQIYTYMTQNPFSLNSIAGWQNLHNSDEYNIIIGVYGQIRDKDRDLKIKQLRHLKSLLKTRSYKENLEVMSGAYYYVIGSNQLVPTKRRIKIR